MEFNPQIQLAGLLEWMAEQMNACHGKTAVIGISGGKDSSTVAAVKMSDLSLVTSGDYQRYYVVDGVRYHHLIDPATLWPAAYFDGVSVLAPDSGVADCLTTGLFCLPLEEGRQLVESLDGVEALWCTTDGEVITSSGWSEHTN